jgi:hypothetical protein
VLLPFSFENKICQQEISPTGIESGLKSNEKPFVSRFSEPKV